MDSEAGKEQSLRHRDRFIGKLFGKESKEKKTANDEDVNAFLHGYGSDRLNFASPSPERRPVNQPVLSKIDTTSATRWPTAADVDSSRRHRGRSASPKRSKKGLVVHFTHEEPEIIGEGGDEAEAPTAQISQRRRAQSHPPSGRTRREDPYTDNRDNPGPGYRASSGHAEFQPRPVQRVQTGIDGPRRQIGSQENHPPPFLNEDNSPEDGQTNPHFGHHKPLANKAKDEMLASEGKVLRQALSGQFNVSDDEDDSIGSSPESKRQARDAVPQFDALRIGSGRNAQGSPSRPIPSKYPDDTSEMHRTGEEGDSLGGSPSSVWSSAVDSVATSDSPQSLLRSAPANSSIPTESPHSISRTTTFNSNVPTDSPQSMSRSATFKTAVPTDNSQMASRSATLNTSSYSDSQQSLSRSATVGTASPSNHRLQQVFRSATDNAMGPGDNPQPPSRSATSRFQDAAAAAVYESPQPISRTATSKFQDLALAVGDEALREFSNRVSHLFTLFRLSTESKGSLSTCSLEELVRIALWWFLKGRSDLETTIRERPITAEAQQASFFLRQQAYTDLAKSLWIMQMLDELYPDMPNGIGDFDPQAADILESRQAVSTNLRKLTMSMKRNNILPPGNDAPLQHGLNSSVWVLTDGNQSLLSLQRPTSSILLSESLPLGDTKTHFHYGKMFVEGILIEDGSSRNYRCPCLVSVLRHQKDKALKLIVSNQDASLKFCVQGDKNLGPSWDDVTWRTKHDGLDMKLPRGFKLQLKFSKNDYRTLMGMYDYHKKIHTNLRQRQDEELLFEKVFRLFQYFDQDLQSLTFPKEPMPYCQVRFFEKYYIQKGASGVRRIHCGFRVALVTGVKTRELRGINKELPPALPLQLGVLKGEGGHPALLIKLDDGQCKFAMAFTFDDVAERTQLHSLLVGSALGREESLVAELRVKSVGIESNPGNTLKYNSLQSLDWQTLKVINEDGKHVQKLKTVLSDRLRVIMDFRTGIITDRVNVGPGELKFRLDVRNFNELRILRQSQRDMTMSLFDAAASKELPPDLTGVLDTVATSDTIRSYTFPGLQELHMFQAALTGFMVLFDGYASSFNISRRRMVVPIYKKWDAATTRLQVVKKEGVVQLLAFFENFSHGECMNFALKGTDIFESTSRSGKYSLRIVDAKFPLAKSPEEGKTAADSGFVSLDLLPYPGEHDDITIIFDTEADLERFSQTLPVQVKAASSRMGGSIKR